MNILHLVHCYYPAVGGTEYIVQHVSERLVREYNDKVTIFTSTGYNCDAFTDPSLKRMEPGIETINNVNVVRYKPAVNVSKFFAGLDKMIYNRDLPLKYVWKYIGKGPLSLKMFFDTINAYDYDIIMASCFPLLHMAYAYLAGKLNNVKVIIRGTFHISDIENFDNPIFYHIARNCDCYITNSADEKKFLLNKGVPEKKLNLIPCGVNPDRFKVYDTESIKNKYNIPAGCPVVLFVGQKIWYKGISFLIESMMKVWEKFPETILLLCGSAYSKYIYEVENIINGLPEKFKNKIINIDNFDETEKSSLYRTADIFVLPSRYESFGIAYLEAWSSGLPVIGCRTEAVKSVIRENIDGLLTDIDDCGQLAENIMRLLNNESLRKKMGSAGHKRVLDEFTLDIVTRKFRDCYMRCLVDK